MKKAAAFLAIGLLCLPVCVHADGGISQPRQALAQVEPGTGWSVGARYSLASRELRTGDTLLEVKFQEAVAHVGYAVLPFLNTHAEGGWTRAERTGDQAEGGYVWALGATARLLEHVWDESPVVGRKQDVGLELDVSFRHGQSNFEEDFDWHELTVSPAIRYTVNRRGNYLWPPFDADMTSLVLGLVFSDLNADLGPVSLDGNRDFALMVGADLRFLSAWVLQLRGTYYKEQDYRVGAGLAYFF